MTPETLKLEWPVIEEDLRKVHDEALRTAYKDRPNLFPEGRKRPICLGKMPSDLRYADLPDFTYLHRYQEGEFLKILEPYIEAGFITTEKDSSTIYPSIQINFEWTDKIPPTFLQDKGGGNDPIIFANQLRYAKWLIEARKVAAERGKAKGYQLAKCAECELFARCAVLSGKAQPGGEY